MIEPAIGLTPLERSVIRQLHDAPVAAVSVATATRPPAPTVEEALGSLVLKSVARKLGPLTFRRAPV